MEEVCFILLLCVSGLLSQGIGSGSNGNLRLCVVEGRGSYKRAGKFCPVLDKEKAGVECVLGTDRLDCLRRMGKGTVDLGVFNPEDLVAAQWADLDVLVTTQLTTRRRSFERSIVAVVNRRILPESSSTVEAVLRGSSLCHPGVGGDDIRPLSDTLAEYLESVVTDRSCNASLSLAENRLKALAGFFGKACRAGPWLPDEHTDVQLKRKYPSLCSACGSGCAASDRYWGVSGALACLAEGAGDVTWADHDNIAAYFGLTPGSQRFADPARFAYLCRDGTWQPLLSNPEPCVWLNKPWRVVVAKRKAAAAVSMLAGSLTRASVTVDSHWHGALAALLETNQALPEPLHPPKAPLDYLASARGFREAYSVAGCHPPRHITLCTSSLVEKNKCEWLSEAAAVYGVAPRLQCAFQQDGCVEDVREGRSDAFVGDSNMLVVGDREHSISPILHETTPIVEKTNTVVAYVWNNSQITNMADMRGKRAFFPRFDGYAWHSVLKYLKTNEKQSCKAIFEDFFSEICAPGIENTDFSEKIKEKYSASCYKDGGKILDGDLQALRALAENKSDVAFVSMNSYYAAQQNQEPWARNIKNIIPICPEENKKYCFLSWSNIGHVFTRKNITDMKRHEIINVFTKLDQLFGKNYPFHNAMFSMYGPFNHYPNIIFHNNTKTLTTDYLMESYPYNKIPMYFEKDVQNVCSLEDLSRDSAVTFSAKISIVFVSLSIVLLR